MKLSSIISVSLALLLATPVAAQAPWNRRVSGIAVVPGVDSRDATLYASVQTQPFESVSQDLDLSTDVEFFVNGASVGIVPIQLEVSANDIDTANVGCWSTCYGSCGLLDGCAIHIPTGTFCVCSAPRSR